MEKDERRKLILLAVGGFVLWKYLKGKLSDTSLGPGAPQSNASILGKRTMTAIQDFISKIKPIADQVETETKISSVLGMSEAAEESNYGLSQLSRPDSTLQVLPAGTTGPANNLFGITAEEGTYWRSQGQPYVMMPTHEWVDQDKVPPGADITGREGNQVIILVKRPFRAYPNWEASYRDWARLMQTKAYQAALAGLQNGDAQAFGAGLNAAGYASDKAYGTKIATTAGTIQANVDQMA